MFVNMHEQSMISFAASKLPALYTGAIIKVSKGVTL